MKQNDKFTFGGLTWVVLDVDEETNTALCCWDISQLNKLITVHPSQYSDWNRNGNNCSYFCSRMNFYYKKFYNFLLENEKGEIERLQPMKYICENGKVFNAKVGPLRSTDVINYSEQLLSLFGTSERKSLCFRVIGTEPSTLCYLFRDSKNKPVASFSQYNPKELILTLSIIVIKVNEKGGENNV